MTKVNSKLSDLCGPVLQPWASTTPTPPFLDASCLRFCVLRRPLKPQDPFFLPQRQTRQRQSPARAPRGLARRRSRPCAGACGVTSADRPSGSHWGAGGGISGEPFYNECVALQCPCKPPAPFTQPLGGVRPCHGSTQMRCDLFKVSGP